MDKHGTETGTVSNAIIDRYGFVDDLEWRVVEVHHNDPSTYASTLGGPQIAPITQTRLWSVRDGVDGLPTWRPDSYAVFVPFRPNGFPICSTEQDPPRFPGVCVRDSFIRAFGDKFGDPRVVEGHGYVFGHGTVMCSYVVVAMLHPEREP